MARADSVFAHGVITNTGMVQGAGTQYVVQTNGGVLYGFFVDSSSDLSYKKSTDAGLSWSLPVIVRTGSVESFSIWYDRWSGLSTDHISLCYLDANDVFFRTIDTASSDALSTETTIFDGASSATGRALSHCRSRGGNVYCKAMIDAGAEGAFKKLANADFPNGAWSAALTEPEAIATTDQWILLPDYVADNNDIQIIFVDASADGLSLYRYDDSGNAFAAEVAIIADGSYVDLVATTPGFPNLAAATDLTNSKNILVAWTRADFLNSDLRCWTIDADSVDETATNVVLNSTDDQGLCAVSLNLTSGAWHVFYGGKSDGSETFTSAMNVYYKTSTDSGATWGSETLLTSYTIGFTALFTCPRYTGTLAPVLYHNSATISGPHINIEVAAAGGGRLAGRGGLAG